jgi:glycosyltransferase involved in cell wall biosynthesis
MDSTVSGLVRAVPIAARRVIDVRCGIGFLAHEIRRARPDAFVRGWDPRDSGIRVAKRLFGGTGIQFAGSPPELAEWREFHVAIVILGSPAELALFEGQARTGLHDLLSAGGQLLVAVTEPNRGPVASGVGSSDDEMRAFADQVGGQIKRLSAPAFPALYVIGASELAPRIDASAMQAPQLEPRAQRRERARKRLGRYVSDDGYVIPKEGHTRVLIVSPNRAGFAESFVKANIEGLPAHVDVCFGELPAAEDEAGQRTVPKWARGLGRMVSIISPTVSGRMNQFWLHRVLAERKPAVVLAEYGPTGVQLLDACRRRSIPLVTQFFGFDASEHAVLDSLRDDYRKVLTFGYGVAVSRDIAERLSEVASRPERIRYIPCGVDPALFGGADPASSPPAFLAVARFVEKKAPHLTILAFKEVLTAVPDARLRFVGDGPLLHACYQLANALGLAAAIDFLGSKPHDELPKLYRESRAFVQHSMTSPSGDREGTPVAILEAGASGLPVVSTRHAGILDAVLEGQTGLLVDEGDYLAMAEQMIRLARDPALAARLGRHAQVHIATNFASERTLADLWSVLLEAIESRPGETAASSNPGGSGT